MIKRTFLILIVFFLGNCSPQNNSENFKHLQNIPKHLHGIENLTIYPVSGKIDTIQFVKEISFGETANHLIVIGGRIGHLVRVDRKERVYIPDRQRNTIHVFNQRGDFIGYMGREGKGPGEFIEISTLHIGNDHLYIQDSILKNINVFSLESLKYSYSINLTDIQWDKSENSHQITPGPQFFKVNDTTLLMQFTSVLPSSIADYDDLKFQRQNQYYYYLMNEEAEIVSNKILEQKKREWIVDTFRNQPVAFHLPIHNESLISLSNDKKIFSVWTDEFLIKVYNLNGEYLESFYFPYKKSVLHREDLVSLYDYGYNSPHENAARSMDLPETWPAIDRMIIDDENQLWLSTIVDDQQVYQWWVIDAENGELQARFRWPRNKPIENINNGKIYTRESDIETGLQQIVRYRIDMEEV